MIEDERVALPGGHLAQGFGEGDPVQGGPALDSGRAVSPIEPGALPGPPPPEAIRQAVTPNQASGVWLGRPAAPRPGPDKRLLHGVLSVSLVPGHGVELSHEPGKEAA